MDLAVPVDHRVKIKESEKRDKYLDIAREVWKLRVMVIPIVNDILRTIPKGLERELEELEIIGQIKTIQITALLRFVRILRRVLET